jgi:hypothetical protein
MLSPPSLFLISFIWFFPSFFFSSATSILSILWDPHSYVPPGGDAHMQAHIRASYEGHNAGGWGTYVAPYVPSHMCHIWGHLCASFEGQNAGGWGTYVAPYVPSYMGPHMRPLMCLIWGPECWWLMKVAPHMCIAQQHSLIIFFKEYSDFFLQRHHYSEQCRARKWSALRESWPPSPGVPMLQSA